MISDGTKYIYKRGDETFVSSDYKFSFRFKKLNEPFSTKTN